MIVTRPGILFLKLETGGLMMAAHVAVSAEANGVLWVVTKGRIFAFDLLSRNIRLKYTNYGFSCCFILA